MTTIIVIEGRPYQAVDGVIGQAERIAWRLMARDIGCGADAVEFVEVRHSDQIVEVKRVA